ncbi:MAG: LysR family transcriptional regulator, partial [Pseudomonadota bacterium]
MASITLKQLRYFEAVARLGHFGRAAESCAVSQPALSVQIRDLEQALGGALIERAPRSLQLTDLGRDVLGRARSILADIDDLQDHARAVSGSTLKRLKLGVIPTIA